MSLERWGYQFDGPFYYSESLRELPGVYVVWCLFHNYLNILDVGESDNVKERLGSHERRDCWKNKCPGIIQHSAAYISDQAERLRLEKLIRNSEIVPCGER